MYTDRQLKKALRTFQNAPSFAADEALKQKTRMRVFARVYRDAREEEAVSSSIYSRMRMVGKLFIPLRVWRYALQPALVMVLVLGVTTSGWITSVQASEQSLPGDILYPVKIASERTQVALASITHDARVVTDLRVAFAKRRLEEVTRAAKEQTNTPKERSKKTAAAFRGFKQQISTLQTSLQEINKNNPEQAAEIARQMENKSGVLTNALAEAKEATGEVPGAQGDIREAEVLVQETSDRAVAVIIEKHAAGDPTISEKEVTKTVEEKLERAGESAQGANTSDTKEVAETIKQAQKLIKEKEFEEALARVRQIQEIAARTVPPADVAGEIGEQQKTLVDTIVKVIKNVTSTIIGE